MAGTNNIRLNKVLREFNISLDRAVEFLNSKGQEIEARPTTKISQEIYNLLTDEFQTDKSKLAASKERREETRREKEAIRKQIETEQAEKKKKAHEQDVLRSRTKLSGPKQVGKIDLEKAKKATPEAKAKESPKEATPVAPATQEVKETVATPVKETPAAQEPDTPAAISNRPKRQELKIKGKATIENAPAKKEAVKKEASPTSENKEEKAADSVPAQPASETAEKTNIQKTETADGVVESEKVTTQYKKLDGPNFTGQKIDLSKFKKPEKKKDDKSAADKKKRKRISKPGQGGANNRGGGPGGNRGGNRSNNNRGGNRGGNRGRTPIVKAEPTEEEVQKQVRETLEKLQGKSSRGKKGAKYRRDKRDQHRQKTEIDQAAQEAESKVLKVTEFVTVSEVATMMDVGVTQVISACMSLGMMVTMNQRLDAETLSIVAEEFGYTVDFVTADLEQAIEEIVDAPEDLSSRAPIVTVMGHVDHGKTSLLDYIRQENVIAGESGGITQHIGAYGVKLDSGQKIAFLDTPGHEAFTAMRARGAQVTDIAIIVIAADDDIMPQTKEAISHAQAAGVPIVFAINKVDKQTANPDNIKTKLAAMNLLVEDWGGTIQSHDISAKTGLGVNELLEKVLLEAEVLELKANADRSATGTVVEAFLDKGRGYVSTVLVQSGTLKVGDYLLAGKNSGKVKAMHDERGKRVLEAGPSTPVSVLGLDGAPQAGDKFNVMEDEREAKDIASKRSQLHREQSVRTQRHITLDEIGRRIALGDFKELNIILKGDVDGSVEALTDSFQKLSTDEIHVNIIHKAVGAITESDVLLASASDAIIIGFNVRPAGNARMVADKEEIDIRMYSIIYDAINDLKDAMEGMLSPEMKEEITGTAEVRQTFKISKVGTIAGCMVLTGKIFRNNQIRLIRESVVIYTGELSALKRFKDDVKEVAKGYDCGMQIKNYNDLKEGDVIEAFQEVAVKKTLK